MSLDRRNLNINTMMKKIVKLAFIAAVLCCSLVKLTSCSQKSTNPLVTTSEVSEITTSSATSGGAITNFGNTDVISRGVCWSNSPNPSLTDNKTVDGSGTGFFTSTLSGLLPGTEYHVRAYATHKTGTSYGSDLGFTTSIAVGGGNNGVNENGALIIEGQAYVNAASSWNGVLIPRLSPTQLIFRNNSITSVNSQGYLLQAGDESPGSNNNHLDGEIISGNRFTWNGTSKGSTITHGVFAGYNINSIVEYNYLQKVPTGIVLKSNGMTFTKGGVAYNIINQTGNIAVVVKGINGVSIYGNTFYTNEVKFTSNSNPGTNYGIISVFANDGLSPMPYSKGTKIKNNIFYTVNQIYNISIEDQEDLPGFESDYNVFWCEAGTPMFKYLGTAKTFAQWQALGYDLHSVVINPNFNNLTDFVPAARLDYGTDLGIDWQTGLSIDATWVVGIAPATANQNGIWQVGARIR